MANMQLLGEQGRIWDALCNMAYLSIAGALYWRKRMHGPRQKKLN